MGTKFKGTQGKWTIGIVPDYNDTLPSAMLEIQSKGYWICKIQNKGMIQNEEGSYNSLLISKAPEMLEMLIQFESDLRNGYTIEGNKLSRIQKLINSATEL